MTSEEAVIRNVEYNFNSAREEYKEGCHSLAQEDLAFAVRRFTSALDQCAYGEGMLAAVRYFGLTDEQFRRFGEEGIEIRGEINKQLYKIHLALLGR